MTLSLWLFVALGATNAAVTYSGVPAEVVRIQAYEWRDGRAPVELAATIDRVGDAASVQSAAGANVTVRFARSDGFCLLDGPFRWPAEPTERVLDMRWRRSITIDASGSPFENPAIHWIAAMDDEDGWPRCVSEAARVTCWGVRAGAPGIAYSESQGRTWWAAVSGGAARFRSSAWGRLVIVRGPPFDSSVRVRLRHPVASTQRSRSVRLDTQDVAGATGVPVGQSAIWVAGDEVPEGAWVEVLGVQSGPVYLSMRELAEGPTSLPIHVALPDARVLDGTVLGQGDAPAAGSVVTLFRLLEKPPATTRDRDPPRRVLVRETTADRGGAFRFDRLGEADYEVVAWHPQLGRSSSVLTPGSDRVEIHLRSAGVVRGRIVLGGMPVEGVDVVGVPDQNAIRDAADLVDLKGGDARTGRDGRFLVSLAAAGGELRIGGGRYPVRRIALTRMGAETVDVGDIELGLAIAITVVLDADIACVPRATGPVGRTGLQVVLGTRTGPGLFAMSIPEPGFWEFGLMCGDAERGLSPAVREIGPALLGKEVRFLVR
ncbi:MAG TPA: hypothetical protein VN716_07975 [Vicinamibacterales bacterium]|nr:hypothetical protein [Vicinamibacterales bacterium]